MTDSTTRADYAVVEGLELVGIVREFGRDTIEEWLRHRDRLALETLVVVLAAMVPDDQTPGDLLAWCDPARARAERNRLARLRQAALLAPKPRKECGTHAAFNRHRNASEMPCEACVLGERIYQRDRGRRRRQTARNAA
ncbi:MAG: hypothetical protein JWM02_3664 [Frankiales bacterium]|nr:hypothetical protein [Frankiales bacterium]